ncbi:MAG: PEFG-CTERM sorting domain-containing protein [Candidatus Nitrosotenuis sp.]|nr:MAG: PEFG-CTERM sorting domain-containing protein [Candidatus Nitrosotenuis sp.]
MNNRLALLLVATLVAVSITSIHSAYAHTSQVIGDYKVEIGWDTEPAIAGLDNAVTVMITPASEEDKSAPPMSDMGNATMGEGSDHVSETEPTNGISGLASSLDVSITVNGKKTTLAMVESEETPGLYIGKLTLDKPGAPTVHVFTTINGTDVEASFHPEAIEDGSLIQATSSDGSVHVDLITTAPSKDEPMDVNIAFKDSDGNLINHVNYDIVATQGETEILNESGVHTHTGQDNHSTEAATSDDPVDVQVKILGIGLPDDPANWSGPKDDVIPIHVTPEFGSIAMIVLGVAIVSIVGFSAKSKIIPKL